LGVGRMIRAFAVRLPTHLRRAVRMDNRRKLAGGLPPGLTRDVLDPVVRLYLKAEVLEVSHEHLSNWKPSGAYRVRLATSRNPMTLIFKDADYSLERVPAQQELPVRIGTPEYAVLSASNEPLQRFLPRVYWSDKIDRQQRYRYLMEDLNWRWARPTRAGDVMRAVRTMPHFHSALNAVFSPSPRGLIDYDQSYSASLRVYVANNVDRFLARHPNDEAARLWQEWPTLESAHIATAPNPELGSALIHGDFNRSNLYLHWRKSDRLKAVDWEWCGKGYPHTDLASVLKYASSDVVARALREYARISPELSLAEHIDAFAWCRLQNSIRDAGYVAAQFTDFEYRPKVDPSGYLIKSLQRARAAVDILEGKNPVGA
jgi:hypothetical protein